MDIKVLTLNVWDVPFWFAVNRKKRMHQLGAFLKKNNPDIICLQESFDTKHRTLTHETLGKANYMAGDLYEKTRRILLYKKIDKTGGLITFSKFPILKTSFTPYPKHPFMSIPERLGTKGFLETYIKTPKGFLRVINTHFLNGKTALPKRIRMAQIDLLIKRLKKLKITTIIAGDFNEEAKQVENNFSIFLQKTGFFDCASFIKKIQLPTIRIDNPYTAMLFNIRQGGISERYDHVFFKNGNHAQLEVKNLKTLIQKTNPLSDHEPVLATFKIYTLQ